MNTTPRLHEVPYTPDSCELFELIRELPGAVLLDSAFPHSVAGRYDIMTAAPAAIMAGPPRGSSLREVTRWFSQLGELLTERFGPVQPAAQDIPFSGGLIGNIDYESGLALNHLPASADAESGAWVGLYDWCVIQDHLLKRATLVAQPQVSLDTVDDLLARLRRGRISRTGEPFRLMGPFSSNLDEGAYRKAFERIQTYIHAGDCYQVNLAQRFSAAYQGDPWQAYRQLRRAAAAPFSAYMAPTELGDALICLSPERFLSLHGTHVETAPIKGTRPRHDDAATDRLATRELRNSVKDRAENLMIVDLLRNDLGRSCVPGSIHVDKLFEIQSYPTVHHMVSTISGELASDSDALTLLRDSFPGGSITGAPKRRAMEVISELEPDARQAYCGSVFYLSADGRMDSNIAIRSLLCHQGTVHCWGGGGIVADSDWQREYRETWDKVGRFLSLLEETLTA
ncbi:MAG: aminodeoxychorismate synthase component I [Pseudomonadota bacterium]